jgi:deoxyribodipyrimidine photo-lyase
MRAMVASFFGYILKQWWKTGADFMYYHLIDADPAINYAQWQQGRLAEF